MNAVLRTKRFWLRVALAACGSAALAGPASAQIGWAPDGEVCTTETTVSGVVTEKKTCVRWKPVTQVCMKRQDCVTYRDECRVGYRPEQYVECVPKTCYDQITVDEGCWKMVWCPKPVTKVVPRQTVEKRLATRNVPYRYTEKVPQVVSRMVPEYKTAYVPEQYQTVERKPFCQTGPAQTVAMRPVAPSCAAPVAAPSCASPAYSSAYPAPMMSAPAYPMPAEPGCAAPMMAPTLAPTSPTPTYSPEAAPAEVGANFRPAVPAGIVPEPTPDPLSYYPTQQQTSAANSSATWTTVKPRHSGPGDDSSGLSSGGSSLASLWTRE